MKRKQRTVLSLLLACVMGCVPAAQVLAASSYDAAQTDLNTAVTLFPGDSLTGLSEGIAVIGTDGTATTLVDGAWTNASEDVVYSAVYQYEEDGTTSVALSKAGYVLTVVGGTSESAEEDGSESKTTDNHYTFTAEEKVALEEKYSADTDIAYYQSGEKVKITAAEPEEGYEFLEWTIAADDEAAVVVADPSAAETTIVMADSAVTVTAVYQEAAPAETETQTEAPVEVVIEEPETEAPAEVIEEPETEALVEVIEEPETEALVEVTEAPETEAPSDSLGTTEMETPVEPTEAVQSDDMSAASGEDISSNEGSSDDVLVIDGENGIATSEITYATLTVNYETGAEDYADTWSETYAAGDTVTVEAGDLTADGYEFAGWYVSSLNVELDDPAAETITFTMPESDVVILASYTAVAEETETEAPVTEATAETDEIVVIDLTNEAEAQTEAPTAAETEMQTETVTEAPTEATVYSVTVDGTVVGSYAAGETVTVAQPAADTGMVFSSWMISNDALITLSDVGDGSWTFTMPSGDVVLSSIFDVVTYTVTIVNGTTGSGASTASFEYGNTVTIAAAEAPDGMTFDHWSSTGATEVTFTNDSSETTSFTMPAGDVEVTAVFVNLPNTYTVKVSNGLINGSYTEHTFEEGTQITVTANANQSGEEFSGWTVNDGTYDLGDSATSSSVTVTVTEDLSFVANYKGISYSITLKTEGNGDNDSAESSSDYTECTAGTTVTITAADPAAGYAFDYWTVNTQNVTLADASASTTTFTMPAADVTITAVYKQVQYTVTIENGSSSQTSYYYGDTVTITSNYPASGKEFSAWTVTSGNVTFTDASRATTTFTMPASNVTIAATYKDGPTASDNYISGLTSGESYLANDKLTFTAVGAGMSNSNPNPGDIRFVPTGYSIGNVSNSWSASPYEASMSIKSTGEYTLSVTFARQVYDGSSWVADGTTSTTSVTFNIVTSLDSVETGDTTPIVAVAAVAAVACLVFVILLVVFIRRRRSER